MPLAGIEAIFSSTDLQVVSEDTVYTLLVEWAREQYPDSEERHRVWSSRLLPLVRVSHMSWAKLHEVLASTDDDVDHDQTTKCITDVLLHKAYPAHQQGVLLMHLSFFAKLTGIVIQWLTNLHVKLKPPEAIRELCITALYMTLRAD
jgi:hypothetical protein